MDAATKTKWANALMTRFTKLYKEAYGVKPDINLNTARWGYKDVVESLGPTEATETLEYYFTLRTRHDSSDFIRRYNEYNRWMIEDAEDEANRKILREATRKKLEELNRGGSPQSDQLDLQE